MCPLNRPLTALVVAVGGWLVFSPAKACSLALVVAMDVSASVDAREHQLQLQGLSGALMDPSVVEAIETVGGIWFHSFEWSDRYKQVTQAPWSYLTDAASAEAAARRIAATPRSQTEFPTALGYALGHAAVVLNRAPERCDRRVIDVAGDGINNDGFGPKSAYRAFDFNAVSVNALVVGGHDETTRYFEREVIRGPGAFVEQALDFEDYREAMTRKLLREIGGNQFASFTR
ncbi:MAG: DUF1194 domain-containing protein [Roseibium sp.]|nr:DUF1194 domain-containing protein [Roseibium sp.]